VAAQLERDKATLTELAQDYYDRGLIDRDEFFANRGPSRSGSTGHRPSWLGVPRPASWS